VDKEGNPLPDIVNIASPLTWTQLVAVMDEAVACQRMQVGGWVGGKGFGSWAAAFHRVHVGKNVWRGGWVGLGWGG
jgi:hypothetical protein